MISFLILSCKRSVNKNFIIKSNKKGDLKMKFKRLLASFLSLVVLSSTFTLTVDANSSNIEYSENELNELLLTSGYPEAELNEMSLYDKSFIIKNSGEVLQYDGSVEEKYYVKEDGTLQKIVPPSPGSFSTMTIPTTDLTLRYENFTVLVGGVKYVDVYPSFQWRKNYRPKNDSLGVAIPQGWAISSGQQSCQTQRQFNAVSGSNNIWEYNSNCGGAPATQSIYGYSWSNFDDPNIGQYNYTYKGTMYFRARKVNSSALNRFVGTYVKDTSASSNTSYSVSINWGFVGFSVSGSSSSGGIDTQGFSKDIIM